MSVEPPAVFRKEALSHVALAVQLGAGLITVHAYPSKAGVVALDTITRKLHDLIEIANPKGIRVAIETTPAATTSILSVVLSIIAMNTRLFVTLDTEFLAAQGELLMATEARGLWDAQRVANVHVKDYAPWNGLREGRAYLAPGEGTVDFDRFYRHLTANGYKGFLTLEASFIRPDGGIDMQGCQQRAH